MGNKLNLFFSGAGVSVEKPADNLDIKRFKNCALITQKETIRKKNSDPPNINWFRFVLPTPTPLFRNVIKRSKAFIIGTIYEGATIKRVHFHHCAGKSNQIVFREDSLNITGKTLNEWFELPEEDCTIPLEMSILVEFRNGGKVVLRRAGASFEQV